MSKKAAAVLGCAFAFALSGAVATTAGAATVTVQCADLPAAIADAQAGDVLQVRGKCEITTNTVIDKQLTIKGRAGSTIFTSGTTKLFTITAPGTVIENMKVVKTDKTGPHNLIGIQADDVSIVKNTFEGQYVLGDSEVSRALEVSTVENVTISRNTVKGLRQPAYINDNTTGVVERNRVQGSRGFVAVANTQLEFARNTWRGNFLDIALISGSPNNYDCEAVRRIVVDNNGAKVENQAQVDPCPTYPLKARDCARGAHEEFTIEAFASRQECAKWARTENRPSWRR